MAHGRRRRWAALLALSFLQPQIAAQLNGGILRGTARDAAGVPVSHAVFTLTNDAGNVWNRRTGAGGEFHAVLPSGAYRLHWNGGSVDFTIYPHQTTNCQLGAASTCAPAQAGAGGPLYPGSYSLQGILLHNEPATVTAPLDFSGLHSNRLPYGSPRAFSWTTTSFHFQGMDATDPYQSGRPLVLPDVQMLAELTVRDGSASAGNEIGVFLRETRAAWHTEFASDGTGSLLSDDNLPRTVVGSAVLQPDRFECYTRDHAAITVPLTNRADVVVSGTGQWAAQTIPREPPGADLTSHMYFGNARGRVRTGDLSQVDVLLSGSRLVGPDLGIPAGIEALLSRRLAPPWVPSNGLAETDHLDFFQAGWTRAGSRAGLLEARYNYSTAHLETMPREAAGAAIDSITELNGGGQSGAPPLANLAVRTRHEFAVSAVPGPFHLGWMEHQFAATADWEFSRFRNRFTAPGDRNLITADGAPAYIVELNTPLDSRGNIDLYSIAARDDVSLAPWLHLRAGIQFDSPRGSLPAQSSPAGRFFAARRFPSRNDVIAWNTVAPRVAIRIAPPPLRRVVLSAAFARLPFPLSGRYLDFGNPNSLGGLQYRWEANGAGPLAARFGGAYAEIDPALRRPYADQIAVATEATLPWRLKTQFQAYRRDDRNRIAAINIGVPASAYQPIVVRDPGSDYIPGTFDDQLLTVFSQDARTLGNDRLFLTNPRGLRMLYEGVLARVAIERPGIGASASFLAEKSYGPTNPGNTVWENDPGLVGSLFQDPNTLVNAANRDYFDRAYVGKFQAHATLPRRIGSIELGTIVTYLDGQVFGRQLLISGLPQGPFLINANVRGSPEGGQRAEYVLEWDLRVSRALTSGRVGLRLRADVFNVLNGNNKIVENPFSGPDFNQRPALAIPPPRFVRLGFDLTF